MATIPGPLSCWDSVDNLEEGSFPHGLFVYVTPFSVINSIHSGR